MEYKNVKWSYGKHKLLEYLTNNNVDYDHKVGFGHISSKIKINTINMKDIHDSLMKDGYIQCLCQNNDKDTHSMWITQTGKDAYRDKIFLDKSDNRIWEWIFLRWKIILPTIMGIATLFFGYKSCSGK